MPNWRFEFTSVAALHAPGFSLYELPRATQARFVRLTSFDGTLLDINEFAVCTCIRCRDVTYLLFVHVTRNRGAKMKPDAIRLSGDNSALRLEGGTAFIDPPDNCPVCDARNDWILEHNHPTELTCRDCAAVWAVGSGLADLRRAIPPVGGATMGLACTAAFFGGGALWATVAMASIYSALSAIHFVVRRNTPYRRKLPNAKARLLSSSRVDDAIED